MISIKRMDDRIGKKFSDLRERHQAALICYMVAGYPDLRMSESIIETLVKAGADMIALRLNTRNQASAMYCTGWCYQEEIS